MRHGCCLVPTVALAAALFVSGCETPTDPFAGMPASQQYQKPDDEPVVLKRLPDGLTPDERVRMQYRQMRAKELIQEAKILKTKQQFSEASAKMAEAKKLLEEIPEE